MIKIAHIGDLHIGIKKYQYRAENLLKTLNKFLDYCIKNNIDIVVVCGDIFNARRADAADSNVFFDILVKFNEAGIHIICIPGNHDIPIHNNSLGYPINYISILNKSNKLEKVHLSMKNELILHFRGIDFVHLLYNDFLHYDNFLSSCGNNKKVVISHAYIKNSIVNKKNNLFFKEGIEIEEYKKLLLKHNTICFLNGHVHHPQVMNDEDIIISYSGSIIQANFGEENIDTGFFVYEIDNYNNTRYYFQSLENKLFYSLKYQNNIINVVKNAINQGKINKKSIVRILYSGNDRNIINFNNIESELLKEEIMVVPQILYNKSELVGASDKIYKEMVDGNVLTDNDNGLSIINFQVKKMCQEDSSLYEYYLDYLNKNRELIIND